MEADVHPRCAGRRAGGQDRMGPTGTARASGRGAVRVPREGAR
jgi:hypothetical protein